MRGIYRIDHTASRTHSWLVTIQRRGRIYHRHFSDRIHGGRRNALQAAKAYRDELAALHPPLSRRELCAIRKKSNRSGVSGVIRVDVIEANRGRPYRRIYWDAQWPLGNGRAQHKKFSVRTYGERGAFLRAIRARTTALKALGHRAVRKASTRA